MKSWDYWKNMSHGHKQGNGQGQGTNQYFPSSCSLCPRFVSWPQLIYPQRGHKWKNAGREYESERRSSERKERNTNHLLFEHSGELLVQCEGSTGSYSLCIVHGFETFLHEEWVWSNKMTGRGLTHFHIFQEAHANASAHLDVTHAQKGDAIRH